MSTHAPTSQIRIEAIDMARGLALFAMASYHFAWDLEFFGYLDPGTTGVAGWRLYARCIASSFLFLVGVSLHLAHGHGIRWRGLWCRFAMVAAAAAVISAVTWYAVPGAFIFFGILHHIALASLLGLVFLRAPAWLMLLVAAAVVAAPHFLRAEIFNRPELWWVGLSTANPRSNDFVPLLPWFAAVLSGMAAARLAARFGLTARLSGLRMRRLSPLGLAGRHSLAFYLLHQPVLIGLVYCITLLVPPQARSPEESFFAACEASCHDSRDTEFCTRYCGCMLDTLAAENLLQGVYRNDGSPELRARVEETAFMCTATTEAEQPQGESR